MKRRRDCDGLLEEGAPDGGEGRGRYLEGVQFPIRREDLVARLERNGTLDGVRIFKAELMTDPSRRRHRPDAYEDSRAR